MLALGKGKLHNSFVCLLAKNDANGWILVFVSHPTVVVVHIHLHLAYVLMRKFTNF